MAGVLRRFLLARDASKLLGAQSRPVQDLRVFGICQVALFLAAPSGEAVRARKKSQKSGSSALVGDIPDNGKLRDGNSQADKPRRSPSAYSYFQKEKFAELKRSCDKIVLGKAAKDVAAQWKELSETDKKPYLTSAIAAKLAQPPSGSFNGSTTPPQTPSKISGRERGSLLYERMSEYITLIRRGGINGEIFGFDCTLPNDAKDREMAKAQLQACLRVQRKLQRKAIKLQSQNAGSLT